MKVYPITETETGSEWEVSVKTVYQNSGWTAPVDSSEPTAKSFSEVLLNTNKLKHILPSKYTYLCFEYGALRGNQDDI